MQQISAKSDSRDVIHVVTFYTAGVIGFFFFCAINWADYGHS